MFTAPAPARVSLRQTLGEVTSHTSYVSPRPRRQTPTEMRTRTGGQHISHHTFSLKTWFTNDLVILDLVPLLSLLVASLSWQTEGCDYAHVDPMHTMCVFAPRMCAHRKLLRELILYLSWS